MRWLNRSPRNVLLGCFVVSGAAGLVAQVVWTRWLGLVTGSFATATALVIGMFMAGLGLGSALAGERAQRLGAATALRRYAAVEALLAVLAACSAWAFPAAPGWHAALGAVVPHRVAAAGLCVLLLLPPTCLMGATLPLMLRAYATGAGSLGALYGMNTLGAAAGPLLAAFVLIPHLGLRGAVLVAAVLNALAAGGAWWVAKRLAVLDDGPPDSSRTSLANPVPPGSSLPLHRSSDRIPYLFAFCSGFLALGFELALARLLILTVTGASVYGLAINLSAFLAGLGAGAVVQSRRAALDAIDPRRRFAFALAFAWAFTLTLPLWDRLPLLLLELWRMPLPLAQLGAIRFGLAFLLVLAVAGAFGYALPALAAALPPGPAAAGRLFAWNTCGAVAGSLATGFVLLPALGLDRSFTALGAASLLTAAAAMLPAVRPGTRPALAGAVVAGVLAAVWLPAPDRAMMNAATLVRPHRFNPRNESESPAMNVRAMGAIVHQEDAPSGRIAIRRSGHATALVVNGKPDASTTARDAITMVLIAHLPLAIHPAPRTALVVGLGGGLTIHSLLTHDLARVVCVEIEPAVHRAARWFSTWTGRTLDDPRLRVIHDDARHHLRMSPDRWDVIASEPSNLFVAGTVHLFTQEYYALALSRLAPGGLFCQWSHYYGMSADDCRTVVRTAAGVFPHLLVFAQPGGDFFMLGADHPVTLDPARARAATAPPAVATDLGRIEVHSSDALLGYALWSRADALRWTGPGPVCTDDRPILEFTTPAARDRGELTDANRREFLRFGPLDPLPLASPTGARRLALAVEQERYGALERAAAELREAVRLDPRLKEAWWRLARLESWFGRTDDAKRTLRTGLRSAGPFAPAVALLTELGS